MSLNKLREYMDPIYQELRNKSCELKELYIKLEEAEDSMYDKKLNYIEGTLEEYNNLEKRFNELAREIATFVSSNDVKYLTMLFGAMPNNIVMPFLREGISVLEKNSGKFEEFRSIIKEIIARAMKEELNQEYNDLRVEKLMITSKTKQKAYDMKLKLARKSDIEVFGRTLGTMMSEIREETINQGFENIDEVEKLINSNPEFKKFFIKNAQLVLQNVKYSYNMFFPEAYKRLFGDPQIRCVILDTLPTIAERTYWKKGIIFDILQNLSDVEQLKYARALFVKSTNPKGSEVHYGNIIDSLLCIGISNEEMLNLIANNMGNIIVDDLKFPETLRSITRVMKPAKGKLPEDKYLKLIDLIDTALVDNIEILMDKEINDYGNKSGYNSETFDGFEKFQEEIIRRGIDVFNSALYIGEGDIEECKKTAEKYFGKCDIKHLITMMYGKYGKDRTDIIAGIIEELQARANPNEASDEIRIKGKGHASTAILVGEYIIKLGGYRSIEEMPNDRRILQPIIRQRLPGKEIKEGLKLFVEVQNQVDTDWTKIVSEDGTERVLSEAEIEEELYKLYKEMRDRGHVFADISPENVGRLLKVNRPNYEFRDIDGKYTDIRPTEEAIGLKGENPSEEVLEAGELVVLDTDFVFNEKDFDFQFYSVGWNQTNDRRRRFEERYKEEKENEKKNSERE